MSLLSRKVIPSPTLLRPAHAPTTTEGKRSQRHEVRFWTPHILGDGKIEVVVRPKHGEQKPQAPNLAYEAIATARLCRNSHMARYYQALGTLTAESTSPNGAVSLVEVTLGQQPFVNRRLEELTGTRIIADGNATYTYQTFFSNLRSEKPGVTAAYYGPFGVHDLTAHNMPAWGFTPTEAVSGLGHGAEARIAAGADPDKLMLEFDEVMSYRRYGYHVLQAVENEQAYGPHEEHWVPPADCLNRLAGTPVATPDMVANHVRAVMHRAYDLITPVHH